MRRVSLRQEAFESGADALGCQAKRLVMLLWRAVAREQLMWHANRRHANRRATHRRRDLRYERVGVERLDQYDPAMRTLRAQCLTVERRDGRVVQHRHVQPLGRRQRRREHRPDHGNRGQRTPAHHLRLAETHLLCVRHFVARSTGNT